MEGNRCGVGTDEPDRSRRRGRQRLASIVASAAVYSADELAPLWPALGIATGFTDKWPSVLKSAKRLEHELDFHGLPRLSKDTNFMRFNDYTIGGMLKLNCG
jgi:hypothetical protein